MSETVVSYGAMAPLLSPVGNYKTENWRMVADFLYENGLVINYEGTLLFLVESKSYYDLGFIFTAQDEGKDLEIMAKEADYPVDITKCKYFIDIWYNGSDSNHSEVTLEQFNKGNE